MLILHLNYLNRSGWNDQHYFLTDSHQFFSLFIISIIQYYNKVHRYTIKIKPGGGKAWDIEKIRRSILN